MAPQIEPFYAEVGRRIQHLRARAGLTQDGLGARLQPRMTRASIANIEAGKQRVLAKTLVDLSSALSVEVSELLPRPAERTALRRVDLHAELTKALPPDAAINEVAETIQGQRKRARG